ncbi:hypothetical protein POP12_006 [Pectobacterium phage POP12]|nr:hypothetical protein POP12_006 [Pectobacterium phage POP12]
MSRKNEIFLSILTELKESIDYDVDESCGICSNVYFIARSKNCKTSYKEELKKIFKSFGLDADFPVEHMYFKDKNFDFRFEDLNLAYERQEDMWDIEINEFAPYRHKLLDMLIEYVSNNL